MPYPLIRRRAKCWWSQSSACACSILPPAEKITESLRILTKASRQEDHLKREQYPRSEIKIILFGWKKRHEYHISVDIHEAGMQELCRLSHCRATRTILLFPSSFCCALLHRYPSYRLFLSHHPRDLIWNGSTNFPRFSMDWSNASLWKKFPLVENGAFLGQIFLFVLLFCKTIEDILRGAKDKSSHSNYRTSYSGWIVFTCEAVLPPHLASWPDRVHQYGRLV